MADLIDRQAAIDTVRSYMADNWIEDSDWHANGIAYEIKRLPTAGAIEVVRCKDCKYCNYPAPRKRAKRDDRGNLIGFDDVQDPPYCDWWCDNGDGFDVEENDFCSHAERKETE